MNSQSLRKKILKIADRVRIIRTPQFEERIAAWLKAYWPLLVGSLGGGVLTRLFTENPWLVGAGALGGGTAGMVGRELMGRGWLYDVLSNPYYRPLFIESQLPWLIGAGIGGLGGGILTRLFTSNPWYVGAGALTGGLAGTLGGLYASHLKDVMFFNDAVKHFKQQQDMERRILEEQQRRWQQLEELLHQWQQQEGQQPQWQ